SVGPVTYPWPSRRAVAPSARVPVTVRPSAVTIRAIAPTLVERRRCPEAEIVVSIAFVVITVSSCGWVPSAASLGQNGVRSPRGRPVGKPVDLGGDREG